MKHTALALACYFMLGSILPRTDFSQLAALPFLFQHYNKHAQVAEQNGQILSFGSYLYIHFIAPDGHQHSDDSHQKLPLHGASFALHLLAEQVQTTIAVDPLLPLIEEEGESAFPPQLLHAGRCAGGLFRPPCA